MKKIFPLIAFLLTTSISFAQKTFQSYGFQTETLQGLEGQFAYYIRLQSDQRIEGSSLTIKFEGSKILNTEKSFIHVLINDVPLVSTKFRVDSTNTIVAQIGKIDDISSGFLKVTLRSKLFIGKDPCQDDKNIGLWIKVLPSSTITWAQNKRYNISTINLSNALLSKKAIVYPNNISAAELQTVAFTYAKLKKIGNEKIKLYTFNEMPDTLSDFIAIGLKRKFKNGLAKKLNFQLKNGQGLLYLKKEVTGANRFDQVLFITANDVSGLTKATQALLSSDVMGSTYQDQLIVSKTTDKLLGKTNKLHLDDLDEAGNLMTGNGSLNHFYRFKTSAFEALPASLNCQFDIKYTGITTNDRGYFNVYLNDILLTSRQLNEAGAMRVTTTVNRYQIKKYNVLRTEFVFYPFNGICIGNFQHFIGQVDDHQSFIEITDQLKEKQLSFYSYPDVFQQNSAILISKDILSSSVQALANIVYQLNDHRSNEIVYRPIVDFSNHVDKYKGRNIIIISDRNDTLLRNFSFMPLQYKSGFSIYSDDQKDVLYKLSASNGSAISQIFKDDQFPIVLSITIPKQLPQKGLLEQNISDLNAQLNLLSGNTLISNKNTQLIFNLARDTNTIVYEGENGSYWKSLFSRYKLLLLSGILFLIFLGYLYVRSKVKESQKIESKN